MCHGGSAANWAKAPVNDPVNTAAKATAAERCPKVLVIVLILYRNIVLAGAENGFVFPAPDA